jgi:hypothetical protein
MDYDNQASFSLIITKATTSLQAFPILPMIHRGRPGSGSLSHMKDQKGNRIKSDVIQPLLRTKDN